MDKLRRALSGNDTPDEECGIFEQMDSASTLSWSTRIKLFIGCFILGLILSLLGSLSLFLNKGLAHFATFYTLGNIVSIVSTCFLMGPFNQIKKMFQPTRVIATLVVLVSFGLTLFAALILQKSGLALLFIIVQSLALTWYSLSYIPYARDAVKKTLLAIID